MFRVGEAIFEDLLAEDEGRDEHDGGDHPRHEDTGGADGDDLVEQDFRAEEHEARLDEVFNLERGLHPLRGADRVGDDHPEHDAPGLHADAVVGHGGLLAEDHGDHHDDEQAHEADEELGQVLAHDEDADAEEQGKGDHQQGQGGEEVYGLGLGGSLGRVGLGLGPILDGRFGGRCSGWHPCSPRRRRAFRRPERRRKSFRPWPWRLQPFPCWPRSSRRLQPGW